MIFISNNITNMIDNIKNISLLFSAIMIIIQLVYVSPQSPIKFENQDEKRMIETRVVLITIISIVILNSIYIFDKDVKFNYISILSLVLLIVQIIYITISKQTHGLIVTNFILLLIYLIIVIFKLFEKYLLH